jgi:hypothetical protein
MDSARGQRHQPSATLPKMGEFYYDGGRITQDHSSRNLRPPPYPQARQHHSHTEQDQGLPVSPKASTFLRSGAPYPQVPNTPDYRPSNQFGQLFSAQLPLPPIGTGRPPPYSEFPDPVSTPAKDLVSLTSRPLQPSETFKNPFDKTLNPYLESNDCQQDPVRGAIDDHMDMEHRRTSALGSRPCFLQSQILAREGSQYHSPGRTGSPTRRGSASFRRNSHPDPQDHRNSSPRGIVKKRRDSSSRKAAVAARAAIVHSARKESSDEVSPKTLKQSWAQIAASGIKEEATEDNVALQAIPQQASVTMKQTKVDQKEGQTWAQIAAAEWVETHSKQEQLRRNSFGKLPHKFRQLKLNTKSDSVMIEVKEGAKEEITHSSLFSRTKPRSVQFTKTPPTGPKNMRAHGRGMFRAIESCHDIRDGR